MQNTHHIQIIRLVNAQRSSAPEMHLSYNATISLNLALGSTGDEAYVTDADSPTYLGVATGGGSVVCKVFFNGTNWIT